MRTLKNCLDRARYDHSAIGHFNISNVEALWAIFDAARELDQPVIIGVSEENEILLVCDKQRH